METIKIGEIDVELCRRNRRTGSLTINRDGTVRFSVPLWMKREEIMDFLTSKRKWLEEKYANKQRQLQEDAERTQHRCEEGEQFAYLGRKVCLHLIYNKEAEYDVKLVGDELRLSAPRELKTRERVALVNCWYYRQLQNIISELTTKWLKAMNERPLTNIVLKPYKSKWGCCRPQRREVSFNTRLIFYPIEAIETVVVHELCHLKEIHHNAHFYSLMTHYLPRYKEYEKALH